MNGNDKEKNNNQKYLNKTTFALIVVALKDQKQVIPAGKACICNLLYFLHLLPVNYLNRKHLTKISLNLDKICMVELQEHSSLLQVNTDAVSCMSTVLKQNTVSCICMNS